MTSKEEYFQLIDQEEGQYLALSLIEDILTRSQHILFEKHIDVQFKFFRRDPGNVDQSLWVPDVEPESAPSDSWARSAVPIKSLVHTAIKSRHTGGASANVDTKLMGSMRFDSKNPSVKNSFEDIVEVKKTTKDLVKLRLSPKKRAAPASEAHRTPSHTPATPSHTGRISTLTSPPHHTDHIVPLEHPKQGLEHAIQEENRRMLLRIHNMQKEGTKVDYSFDHEGRIIFVTKVPPPKLVAQGVKSRVVQEFDPETFAALSNPLTSNPTPPKVEKSDKPRVMFRGTESDLGTASTSALKSRLNQSSSNSVRRAGPTIPIRGRKSVVGVSSPSATGNFVAGPNAQMVLMKPPHHLPPPKILDLSPGDKNVSESLGIVPGTSILPPVGHHDGFVDDPTLDIPPLADTMKLAPGVTLKEGEAVRKGPVVTRRPRDVAKALTHNTIDKATESVSEKSKGIVTNDAILERVLGAAKPIVKSTKRQ